MVETPFKKRGKEEEKKKTQEKKGESKEKTPKKKSVTQTQIAWKVLLAPVITEKATELDSEGKYVFKVKKDANKRQVKKAIEEVYRVSVKKVNTINIPSKKRSVGRVEGRKPGYKKAVVTLVPGNKIEILPR